MVVDMKGPLNVAASAMYHFSHVFLKHKDEYMISMIHQIIEDDDDYKLK